MPSLREELNKLRAFDDPTIEAALNIERTAVIFRSQALRLLRPHGLSPAGYNVLRILRGHSPTPRTCNQIKADMVTPVPDLTRLADRLAADGLVERVTCPTDRRAVNLKLTPAGSRLLATLDRPIAELHRAQVGHLTDRELGQLSRLLAKARDGGQAAAAGE